MSETKFTVPDGYEVTEDGRVFSTATNWRGYGTREMRQTLNSYGYPSVRILVNGVRKRVCAHRLVAAAFLPARPSQKHELRHLNGDKTDNRARNLAWGTAKENAEDRDRHGRTSAGSRHGEAVLLGLARNIKTCSVSGCSSTTYGRRGLCDKHRKLWHNKRRHDPTWDFPGGTP